MFYKWVFDRQIPVEVPTKWKKSHDELTVNLSGFAISLKEGDSKVPLWVNGLQHHPELSESISNGISNIGRNKPIEALSDFNNAMEKAKNKKQAIIKFIHRLLSSNR